MPIYQSHVGAPDYQGVAERFKPFDLPAAVERGMNAAVQMTQSIQQIEQNQANLNLMNVMAPLKVEEARMQINILKKQQEISDLINAPERIKAKLDLETSQQNLQTKLVKDQTEFLDLDQSGAFDDLQTAVRSGDAVGYLTNRDGVKLTPLWKNAQVRERIRAMDDQVAAATFYDEAGNKTTGSQLMAQWTAGDSEALKRSHPRAFVDEATVLYSQAKTAQKLRRSMLRAQNIPDQTIDKIMDAEHEMAAARAKLSGDVAEQVLQGLEQLRKENESPEATARNTAPGQYDITKFGNLGDRDLAIASRKILDDMDVKLEQEIMLAQENRSRIPMDQLIRKRASIRAAKRALPGASGSFLFYSSEDIQPAIEYQAIKKLFREAYKDGWNQAKTRAAIESLNEWLWSFAVNKDRDLLEINQKQRQANLNLYQSALSGGLPQQDVVPNPPVTPTPEVP